MIDKLIANLEQTLDGLRYMRQHDITLSRTSILLLLQQIDKINKLIDFYLEVSLQTEKT